MRSVLVLCGSRTGNDSKYAAAAGQLGRLLAQKNYRLIYGGGKVGLMGVISEAMHQMGGTTVGVMPQRLVDREVANRNSTELITVDTMQERKDIMEKMADAIITLPGGFGSMDELFEVLANVQLDIHQKPVGILNTDGFYDPLIAQIDAMVAEGFVLADRREALIISDTPEKLLERLIPDEA